MSSPSKKKLKLEDHSPFDDCNRGNSSEQDNVHCEVPRQEERGDEARRLLTEERLKNKRLEHALNEILETLLKGETSTLKEELQSIFSRNHHHLISSLKKVEDVECKEDIIPESFYRLSLRYRQDRYFSDQNAHSYDCLRRLFSNTWIESLTLTLESEGRLGQGSLYDNVCHLIKEFNNVGEMILHFEFYAYIMDGSFLLDLLQSAEGLFLTGLTDISAEALNGVFENLTNVSAKIRYFECIVLFRNFFWFLYGIGIEISRVGYIHSDKDIEAFKKVRNSGTSCVIFDGKIEISFSGIGGADSAIKIVFESHETEESLEEAKDEEGMSSLPIYEAKEDLKTRFQ